MWQYDRLKEAISSIKRSSIFGSLAADGFRFWAGIYVIVSPSVWQVLMENILRLRKHFRLSVNRVSQLFANTTNLSVIWLLPSFRIRLGMVFAITVFVGWVSYEIGNGLWGLPYYNEMSRRRRYTGSYSTLIFPCDIRIIICSSASV